MKTAGTDADVAGAVKREALITAEMLQALIRSRRAHLDDFLDGDGPYWISVGLFIDGENGVDSDLMRVMEFADESIETSRHILGMMIERGLVQQFTGADGGPAYRLTAQYAIRFGRYLAHHWTHVARACARNP
ncbi:MAG: hypothetical protein V4659_08645 [Pseudomonadota bacterium]